VKIDPLLPEFELRMDAKVRADGVHEHAEDRLARIRRRISRSGQLTPTADDVEELADAERLLERSRLRQREAAAAFLDLAPSSDPTMKGLAPCLVRVTAPGANLRGEWWTQGSTVVVDEPSAMALRGGGIVVMVEPALTSAGVTTRADVF
jgi:hypothetical protein